MPSPRHFFLAALVALAGCEMDFDFTSAGSVCVSSCPGNYAQRKVEITPLNGSGIAGDVSIFLWDQPMPRIRASIWFPQLGNPGAGLRYSVHIHQGIDCGGVGGPMTHDLGTPAAAFDQSRSPYPVAPIDTVLPAGHLLSGYHLDVHAENDAAGVPLGCGVFPW